jgi:hypothetical protein
MLAVEEWLGNQRVAIRSSSPRHHDDFRIETWTPKDLLGIRSINRIKGAAARQTTKTLPGAGPEKVRKPMKTDDKAAETDKTRRTKSRRGRSKGRVENENPEADVKAGAPAPAGPAQAAAKASPGVGSQRGPAAKTKTTAGAQAKPPTAADKDAKNASRRRTGKASSKAKPAADPSLGLQTLIELALDNLESIP